MELIDANTKNFLYLTLSQYNDENHPVRMRVSMRRDQPFWGGGNSYIACESFRVSAAPSPGGLYYKKIPSDWFLGASIKSLVSVEHDGTPPLNMFDPQSIGSTPAWTNPVAGHPRDPYHSEKHIRCTNITGVVQTAVDNYKTLTFDLHLGGRKVDGSLTNFLNNDPQIVQEFMGRFMNHYRLSKGAWMELQTDGSGKDGNNPGYAVGRLDNSPSIEIRGSGFGADGLSYQYVGLGGDGTQVKADIGSVALPSDKTTYRAPFQLFFRLLQDPEATVVTPMQTKATLDSIGKGLSIQCVNASKYSLSDTWAPQLASGLFEIISLSGLELRGINRMFVGQPNNDTVANVTDAIPKFPITFSGPIDVGAEFQMVVPAGYVAPGSPGSPEIGAGTYFGIVKSLPQWQQNLPETEFYCMVKVPDAAYTAMNNGSRDDVATDFVTTRNQLLQADNVLVIGNDPIATSIGARVTMTVTDQDNLRDYPNPYLGNHTDKFAAVLASSQTDNVIIRRPGASEDRLVYTPNEFFYAFNEPLYADDSNEIILPYCLQTDENGGFVVRWKNTDANNPSNELIISVSLLQQLGLNPWFETTINTLRNEVVTDMYYCKRHQVDDWTEMSNHLFRWMKRSDLSNHAPSLPFHPPNNVPPTGAQLYDRAGVPWTFIDNKTVSQKQFQSIPRRILPDIETDVDGNLYYIFRELPESGRITNNQQVSVESFATFSEITIVIPNLPFQPMLGTSTDERILASLRMPFTYTTQNEFNGAVESTGFAYYGDLIFNTEPSRSYLKITTDQQLYDCDCEVRLIERNGTMHVMELPYKGEFQIKLRLIQTQ